MATTPPPSSRSGLQTPPPPSPSSLRVPSAPLYGAKHDQYEPYPPRSSARIASQRAARSMERTPEPVCPSSPSKMRSRGLPKKGPSAKGETGGNWRASASDTTSRQQTDFSLSISEPDSCESPRRHLSAFSHPRSAATQALPTPAKTPSKRSIQGDLSSTSRTLFPSANKMSTKKPSPFSLESFETSASDEIQIFTDSRDRIPAPGPVSGNPFTSQADALNSSSPMKRGKRAVRSQETSGSSNSEPAPVTAARRRRKVPTDDDHLPKSEEGMTMIFRGKKVFTRFSDLEEEDEDEDDLGLFANRPDLLATDPDILKRAKPLTRSSIKPRVLFPTATKDSRSLEEEDEDATDEEDVEVAEPQVVKARVPPTNTKPAVVTPADTPESLEIPQAPGATRLLRSSTRFATQGEETPTGSNSADIKRKRISPFDQWLRKKQAIEESSSPAPPAKREADSSDDSPVTPHSAKKTRNARGGVSTASSS